MVFPMMLAAAGIGAGGNIISGLLGNSAQQQANEQNYQIASDELLCAGECTS